MNQNNEDHKFLNIEELVGAHLSSDVISENVKKDIIISFLLLCREKSWINSSTGETFYSMPYEVITDVIYQTEFANNIEFNSKNEVLIEQLKLHLEIDALTPEQLTSSANKELVHQLNAYKRFITHIQLAICQKQFIHQETLKVNDQLQKFETDISNLEEKLHSANSKLDEAQSKIEGATTQLITILGIFSAIIVALFGGLSLAKGTTDLLTKLDSDISLFVFVISTLMLSFTGLIVLLTSWITSLNKHESVNYYQWTKVIIFVLLITSCLISGLIIYNSSN